MMYQIHWLHEWCLSVQDFCNSVSGLRVGSVTVMITSLVDVLFNLILSPWLTTRDYVWGNTLEVVHVCVNVICDSTLICHDSDDELEEPLIFLVLFKGTLSLFLLLSILSILSTFFPSFRLGLHCVYPRPSTVLPAFFFEQQSSVLVASILL